MDQHRNPVPPFSVRAATSAADWVRWKRDLELYFSAENITVNERKKAKLLFYGGREIIDLFDSLTCPTQLEEGENVYTQAVRLLSEQINPTHNDLYERCMLRKLKQATDESFSQFVNRVRQQAKKCNLSTATLTADNYILEQLVDGCASDEIRKELLKKGLQPLRQAEELANSIEAVNAQCKAVQTLQLPPSATADSVKRTLASEKRPSKTNGLQDRKPENAKRKLKCFRCNSESHLANDPKCPARKALCTKCNKIGHFATVCQTPEKPTEAEQGSHSLPSTEKAVIRMVRSAELDDRVFRVHPNESSPSNTPEEIVVCTVGGVQIEMFIDSGCKWTAMGLETWRLMEQKNVLHYGFNYKPDIRAYDASFAVQYDVLFTVSCDICCNGLSLRSPNIVIVREKFPVILGGTDAKALQLLRVGMNAVASINSASELVVCSVMADSKVLSKLRGYQLELPIDHKVTPVIQPFRRVPYHFRAPLLKELTELEEMDCIEPVKGPASWVSPMVPVPKGENGIRICVDMRRANAAILDEKHPMPTIEDALPLLKGAILFSKVDLKKAYHQIELHENSREITTFSTPFGLYRWKRLSMGLKCAPEMFQKILENLLRQCKGIFIYLDDILVFGCSQEEHDQNLHSLLQRIEELGLTLSPEKCVYRQSEIQFLGHRLGAGQIKPALDKVRAIREFRHPTSAAELRSFLGLVTYVGKFIPNLSTLLDPLQKTARQAIFSWSDKDQAVFEEVTKLLSDETSLSYFNPDLRTIVMADASPVGLGAVLLQEKDSRVHTICFVNRSLSAVERRYSQTEKEALALIFAVERLKYYLLGRQFDLVTDHKPLEVIFGERSKPCARIERWLLRIQGYKFKVIYRSGKNNIADPLSRLLPDNPNIQTENEVYERNLIMFVTELTPRALVLADIRRELQSDPDLQMLREELLTNRTPSNKVFSHIKDELGIVDDILIRGSRIIMPAGLRERTLQNAHEGHPGIVKMKDRLRSKVWWPNMDAQAENFVRSCDACQKVGKNIIQEEFHRRQLPDGPWQDLAIDFKDLPDGSYLCVVVDYFSRYIEVTVMKTITAKATCDFLDEIFARHGFPYSLTSDQGPQFTSQEFAEYCAENGICHYTTFAYWPQANGEVERQNRSLQKTIQITQLQKGNWRKELLNYLLMYRSTPHTVTGKSPAELLFSRKVRDKLPTLKEREGRVEVRDRDAWNKSAVSNSAAVPYKEIKIGDEVLLKRSFRKQKADSKFEDETGRVTAVDGPAVTVQTPSKTVVRHKNQMEPYTRRGSLGATTPSSSKPPPEVEDTLPESPTIPVPNEIRQSSRVTKTPAYLKDFQCT